MVEAILAGEQTFEIEIETFGTVIVTVTVTVTVTLGIIEMDHLPSVGIWIGTGAVEIAISTPGIHEWASAVVARVLLHPAISAT